MQPRQKRYGLPRRMLAGTTGVLLLVLIAFSIADGTIYYRGTRISSAEHPVAFWLEVLAFAVVALAALYWAFIETRGRTPKE